MAQSNLVHLMREEKTSRGLAELMKELVLASGAPDETRIGKPRINSTSVKT